MCVLLLFLLNSTAWVGCSALMSSATSGMAKNLTSAVLNQDDVLLVKEGAPAYLIAIDGLIEGDPKNPTLLLAGAQLYSAYASSFVSDPVRASRLSTKAMDFGWQALCLRSMELCEASRGRFNAFEKALASTDRADVPTLYGYGAAWAGWVQVNASDWNAVAQLPKVQALMERVIALEPGYDNGRADLYLGVLYTLRPASLGGRPELGRKYFERAIELSKGKDLLAKVLMAKQYARLVFDQSLHDRLLEEVIAADPVAPGYTLSNTIAQEQAVELLAESNEYF
ncbi:MAG: TRAP transporter TatT component family protein [Myxococcota bacterium]|nr:TRAP transporter TatT component family protein [Myxococcota bacterium]